MIYYDYYLLTKYKQDLFVRNKVSLVQMLYLAPIFRRPALSRGGRKQPSPCTADSLSPPLIYIKYSTDCVVLCTLSTFRRACGGGKPSPQDHCGIPSRKSYENRIAKLALKLCGCRSCNRCSKCASKCISTEKVRIVPGLDSEQGRKVNCDIVSCNKLFCIYH